MPDVYVKGRSRDSSELCLHLREDCPRLTNARSVSGRSRNVYPEDAKECRVCTGEFDNHEGGCSGPHERLAELDPDDL